MLSYLILFKKVLLFNSTQLSKGKKWTTAEKEFLLSFSRNTESLQRTKKAERGRSVFIKKKERQRRMQYYKPSRELTRTERIKRNQKKHCASGVKRKKKRRHNKIRDMAMKMKARN